MPCARANASGSPGSAGRHQQVGGPPGCGQTATATGPSTIPASFDARRPRSVAEPPGLQSKRRCGAAGSASATSSGQPACPMTGAATNTPVPARSGSRKASECDVLDVDEALVLGGWLELAERSHLGRWRKQARLSARDCLQLLRGRKLAEPVEETLDEVDLCLRERRVEPGAARGHPRGERRSRPRSCVMPASGTCCRERLWRAPDARAFSRSSASSRSEPPRSSRFSRT